jgi:hypothetical protein
MQVALLLSALHALLLTLLQQFDDMHAAPTGIRIPPVSGPLWPAFLRLPAAVLC